MRYMDKPMRRVNKHPIRCSVCSETIEKYDCICYFANYQSHKRCEPGLIELRSKNISHRTGE